MVNVSVIGATGYAGEQLLSILYQHPQVKVVHVTSESYSGKPLSAVYPHLTGLYNHKLDSLNDLPAIIDDSDIVFVALPHGHALKIAPQVIAAGKKVIDFGGDYRFDDPAIYEQWYGLPHTDPQAARIYALPELHREQIRPMSLVANPGCYTTCSILGSAPLFRYQLVEVDNVVIDAKSGVSGAGRGLGQIYHYPEATENVRAYKIASHRHTPEIEQELSKLCGQDVRITFTPHLVPMSRGILSTMYFKLQANVSAEQIQHAYHEMYDAEPFVRLLGEGGYPCTKNVRGSNLCDIGWHVDSRTGRLIIVSAIDNLVKGAAGQAVQNLNIISGLPETSGLQMAPMYP